jgi:GNAT superfamily N-acetyltransferase
MLNIQEIIWNKLTLEEQAAFSDLAKPHLISNGSISQVILGASYNGLPCGLAIASCSLATQSGEIEHLLVAEPYRRKGVATELLNAMQQELAARGCAIMLLSYSDSAINREELEHILALNKWHPPELMLRRYYYNICEFAASWLDKPRRLPPGITLHPWNEIKGIEKHYIEGQVVQGACPYDVYPYSKGDPEPLNSIFLRDDNRIVAWLATHRETSDTIIYSALYVHVNYRSQGLSLLLLGEGIKRQKGSDVPIACFDLNSSQVSKIWQQFIDEGLAPHAIKYDEMFHTWKELKV